MVQAAARVPALRPLTRSFMLSHAESAVLIAVGEGTG
jgi:hypothetical protein